MLIASHWPPTSTILQPRNLRAADGSASMNCSCVASAPADQQHPSPLHLFSRISTTHWHHSQDLYRMTGKCKRQYVRGRTPHLNLTQTPPILNISKNFFAPQTPAAEVGGARVVMHVCLGSFEAEKRDAAAAPVNPLPRHGWMCECECCAWNSVNDRWWTERLIWRWADVVWPAKLPAPASRRAITNIPVISKHHSNNTKLWGTVRLRRKGRRKQLLEMCEQLSVADVEAESWKSRAGPNRDEPPAHVW